MKFFLFLTLLLPIPAMAAIMACSDVIEEMKAEKNKEGLGILGVQSCKGSKAGNKARYKPGADWKCIALEDFSCVSNKKLKMVQCDREWECFSD